MKQSCSSYFYLLLSFSEMYKRHSVGVASTFSYPPDMSLRSGQTYNLQASLQKIHWSSNLNFTYIYKTLTGSLNLIITKL